MGSLELAGGLLELLFEEPLQVEAVAAVDVHSKEEDAQLGRSIGFCLENPREARPEGSFGDHQPGRDGALRLAQSGRDLPIRVAVEVSQDDRPPPVWPATAAARA